MSSLISSIAFTTAIRAISKHFNN